MRKRFQLSEFLTREEVCDPELAAAAARSLGPLPPAPFPVRGIHASKERGSSLEFSEHTKYVAGDDLRSLDWKVYAKSDRYFVKRFEDERLSRVVLMVDASGSMAYGGREGPCGSKYHLAARVAAALASALIRQGDAVGIYLAGDSPFFLSPRGGKAQLDSVISLLMMRAPSGEAFIGKALDELAERLKKPSTLILISDLLDDEGGIFRGLSSLKSRGVEPRVIQIVHPDEISLPFESSTRFVDLEGPGFLVADPEALRRAYFEEMKAFISGIRALASESGMKYALVRDGAEAAQTFPALMGRTGAL
ncbi:DUF58 domain-containing protein [bacterium]|nr:MAG: DUF58 domain-containing protein [bacterium]